MNNTSIDVKQQTQTSKEKPTKKKRHILLKLILFILIIVAIFKVSNIVAEKQLQSFVTNFPFEFKGEFDSMNYVTEDFIADTVFTKGDKEYTVKWSSSNSCVTFDENGNATLYRNKDNTNVTLTLTYKKLLGKASRDYTVKVIGTSVINLSDIEPVTVDMLTNNEYNRDMQAIINKDGSLQYMRGDFKQIKIKSNEDALAVIKLYREEFNVNSDVIFKTSAINTDKFNITYTYDLYINDIKIHNASAFLVTETETGRLLKIAMDDRGISSNVTEYEDSFNEKEHITAVKSKLSETETGEFKVALFKNGKSINNEGYIYDYFVLLDNESCYEVSVQNNKVLYIYNSSAITTTEMTTAKGFNEKGEQLEFDVTKFTDEDNNGYTTLYDANRNIYALDSKGNYSASKLGSEWFKEDGIKGVAGTLISLYGVIEQKIQNEDVSLIMSNNEWYTTLDAVAVQAYVNMQKTYDFYYNNLGLNSYDNQGSKIVLLTNHDLMVDNACWHNVNKVFMVGEADVYRYSVGINGEVIAHEYGHALFDSKTDVMGNKEVDGLNEAYADIFGCLAFPECDWKLGYNFYDINTVYNGNEIKIGDSFIFRDLTYINNPINCLFLEYPERYKDDAWDVAIKNSDYAHRICLIIGNIAYKMYSSDYFTPEQVTEIWVRSLNEGYNAESTYLTNRRNIIAVAEDMKLSDEAIDFIAECYDEAHIYDSRYAWKTNSNFNTHTSSDNTTVIETSSNAVDGDAILDDNTSKRFLMIYSVADIMFGEGTITIYEEKVSGFDYKDEIEMEKQISAMFNQKYKEALNGKLIGVNYKIIDSNTFDLIESTSGSTQGNIKDTAFKMINKAGVDLSAEDRDMLNNLFDNVMPYVFDWKVYEMTSYEFYDTLGIIE